MTVLIILDPILKKNLTNDRGLYGMEKGMQTSHYKWDPPKLSPQKQLSQLALTPASRK